MAKEAPQTRLNVFRALGDWLYPPRCAACGEFARATLCEKCELSIRRLDGDVCPACGRPLPPGAARDKPCGMCKKYSYNFDVCRSAVSYEGAMRSILIKFKFRRRVVFRSFLMKEMLDCMRARPEMFDRAREADFVSPVPLHWLRLMQRGFNQAELLAAGVAREIGRPTRRALKRVRIGKPQSRAGGWKERVKNVSGVFAARRKLVEGKRVLLIDDVITTGATASECARVLKEAGAAEVCVFTLARRDWQ